MALHDIQLRDNGSGTHDISLSTATPSLIYNPRPTLSMLILRCVAAFLLLGEVIL